MPLTMTPPPGTSVPGALVPGGAQPGFPDAAQYGGYVSLEDAQVIIGRKTFTGPGDDNSGSTGHWYGSVVANDITVLPNPDISASASMFLDNGNGQVWAFFCNSGGQWGVYDQANGAQMLTLHPNTGSLDLNVNGVTANVNGGTLEIDDGGIGFNNGYGINIKSTATTPEHDVGFTLSAHNGANTWAFSARDTNQGDGTLFGFYQNDGVSWVTVLTVSRSCQVTVEDGGNFILGTTTGTKVGTAGGSSGQKLAFYGATPVTQPLLATGAGHTADDVISALQTLGLVRQT